MSAGIAAELASLASGELEHTQQAALARSVAGTAAGSVLGAVHDQIFDTGIEVLTKVPVFGLLAVPAAMIKSGIDAANGRDPGEEEKLADAKRAAEAAVAAKKAADVLEHKPNTADNKRTACYYCGAPYCVAKCGYLACCACGKPWYGPVGNKVSGVSDLARLGNEMLAVRSNSSDINPVVGSSVSFELQPGLLQGLFAPSAAHAAPVFAPDPVTPLGTYPASKEPLQEQFSALQIEMLKQANPATQVQQTAQQFTPVQIDVLKQANPSLQPVVHVEVKTDTAHKRPGIVLKPSQEALHANKKPAHVDADAELSSKSATVHSTTSSKHSKSNSKLLPVVIGIGTVVLAGGVIVAVVASAHTKTRSR